MWKASQYTIKWEFRDIFGSEWKWPTLSLTQIYSVSSLSVVPVCFQSAHITMGSDPVWLCFSLICPAGNVFDMGSTFPCNEWGIKGCLTLDQRWLDHYWCCTASLLDRGPSGGLYWIWPIKYGICAIYWLILWIIHPCYSGLLCWHWRNHGIASLPLK